MKLTAHWPNDLEMPKVVHNVQFTMTNVQSVLLIGQSVVEFIEVFRSMTNCRICRRIVMEHWPNANEKRCSSPTYVLTSVQGCRKLMSRCQETCLPTLTTCLGTYSCISKFNILNSSNQSQYNYGCCITSDFSGKAW